MNRTGKFGAIFSTETEDAAIACINHVLTERITDGRQYVVVAGTLRYEGRSMFDNPPEIKARVLIWLRKWRDAEVGEYCDIPGEKEYATCEVETIDNPFHGDVEGSCKTRTAWTLEGKTFVGALAGWLRIT